MGLGHPISRSEPEHEITLTRGPWPAGILRDGEPVRITLSGDRKWLRVGCTKVSLEALERLLEMTKQVGDTVLQEPK